MLGILFFSQAIVQKFLSREPTPLQDYLLSWMVGVYLWAVLTPFVFWLGHRFRIERRNWVWRSSGNHDVFSAAGRPVRPGLLSQIFGARGAGFAAGTQHFSTEDPAGPCAAERVEDAATAAFFCTTL